MRTILKDYRCFVARGPMETEGFENKPPLEPKLPIMNCYIGFDGVFVKAETLLDTGNDHTIIKPEKVKEIEKKLIKNNKLPKGGILPVGEVNFIGESHSGLQPSYYLDFKFPKGPRFSSEYGFIAPSDWHFDVADIWLGQDIFKRFIVTFNGVNGAVTIMEP